MSQFGVSKHENEFGRVEIRREKRGSSFTSYGGQGRYTFLVHLTSRLVTETPKMCTSPRFSLTFPIVFFVSLWFIR